VGELKKLLKALPFIAFSALLISFGISITAGEKGGKKVVEIKERYFIAQCYDVMLNPDEYNGKLVKLQGMYFEEDDYKGIYRRTPGCCGDDGSIGFRIEFDGEPPKNDDWIEVVGSVMVSENEAAYDYIYLKLEKITVLSKRGKEFVVN
jgi:uncharacterized membrane protein YcgQ (UPF0703/DUF1980 family)